MGITPELENPKWRWMVNTSFLNGICNSDFIFVCFVYFSGKERASSIFTLDFCKRSFAPMTNPLSTVKTTRHNRYPSWQRIIYLPRCLARYLRVCLCVCVCVSGVSPQHTKPTRITYSFHNYRRAADQATEDSEDVDDVNKAGSNRANTSQFSTNIPKVIKHHLRTFVPEKFQSKLYG